MRIDANTLFFFGLPTVVAVGALFALVKREGHGLPWAIALSVLLILFTAILMSIFDRRKP